MTERILLISGSRSFASFPQQEQIYHVFDLIFKKFKFDPYKDIVIVGGAKGIDMMVLNYLMNLGNAYSFAFEVMKADWDKYGKSAGPIRNKKMVIKCTQGAAIWDGVSRGTKNCIDELEKANKLLLKVTL